MKAYDFQPGDIVKVVRKVGDSGYVLGMIGTYRGDSAVEFDKPFLGSHGCMGRCPSHCGWYVEPEALEFVQAGSSLSFSPAPEEDFLSLLGGFSESEVSHAHP